jgi:signal transduction histidine kinase
VRQEYFTGYWERYDVRLYAFGTGGEPRCATSSEPARSLPAAGEGFALPFAAADMPELFIDAVPGERTFYHAQVAVMAGDTTPPAQIIIELHPRIAAEGQGFPDLLLNDAGGLLRRSGRHAFARYEGGVLMEHRGAPFPLHWERDTDETGTLRVTMDGRDLLAYGDRRGSLVVLSTPEVGWLDRATTFSWLFAFFSLMLATAFAARALLRRKGIPPLSIGGKVRVALLLFAALGLLFFSVGAQRLLTRLYGARSEAALLEKSRSLLVELQQKLEGVEALGTEREGYLTHLLVKFSNVFFTDMNLYAPNGALLATSRPQVFDSGLLGRRMNAEAYQRLAREDRSEFVQVERIGNARYRSAYVPLRDKQGALLAYLHLPSFTRQGELDQERGSLLTAIVNLFVLLLALSLLAGVFISNWTTRPLELLKRGLSRIALQGVNEPIAYSGRDEVGDLVRVYNRKVDELRESAEKLARSERESAWREMARQVAHEIKNPLTPMKLSIQHFERTWTPGAPDAKERLQKFSTGMVQQIDALSRIAGEFSHFAQMPPAHGTVLDLREVAEASVSLFASAPNAAISLVSDGPLRVKADREHLLRVFNNLLQNALQAVPDGRQAKVEVILRRDGGEAMAEVRDNGSGIAEEARERIFDPSFTTKSSGMGLGLAMVKRMIDQAGGRVWFETQVGSGTTFFIAIPRANA